VLKWEVDKKDMFNCMKMRILNKKATNPLQMVWNFKNCSTMSLLACKVQNLLKSTKKTLIHNFILHRQQLQQLRHQDAFHGSVMYSLSYF